MLAVRRLLGLEPVAGFYQPLTGGELRARGAYLEEAPVGGAVYGNDALDREALERAAGGRRARRRWRSRRTLRPRRADAVPGDLLARRLPAPGDLLGGMTRRASPPSSSAAIERRDGDLLLDAGAGSGKTSVLVERFVRAVLEDGVDVGAILAITFTEKAAAELRERIRGRLRELGADEAARATEGAPDLDDPRLLRARAARARAAAGLDPAFTVLDGRRGRAARAGRVRRRARPRSQRTGAGADLIAAHGPAALRARSSGCTASCALAGSCGRRCRRSPPLPAADWSRAGARMRRAAAAAELGAIDDPPARVRQALRGSERACELPPGRDPVAGDLGRLALPRQRAHALRTEACEAYREALAALEAAGERGQRGGDARGARGLLGCLRVTATPRQGASARRSTSRTSSCWRASCCATAGSRPSCASASRT